MIRRLQPEARAIFEAMLFIAAIICIVLAGCGAGFLTLFVMFPLIMCLLIVFAFMGLASVLITLGNWLRLTTEDDEIPGFLLIAIGAVLAAIILT